MTTCSHDDRIAALEDELAELKAINEQLLDAVRSASADIEPSSSRRGMLRLLGAAAIGGAAATLTGADHAAAANGDPVTLGAYRDATARPTHAYYHGTPASGSAFVFQSASTATPPYDGLTGISATLSGWASGGRHTNGVYGYSEVATGAGVIGVAEEGGSYGVRAIGSGNAVAVQADAQQTAISASSSGNGQTVITAYAAGSGGWGIRAEGEDTGLKAGGNLGYGIRVCGGRAMILMTPDQKAPPPQRTDAHEAGELDMDKNFDLWLCTVSGTPGTWTKLNQPPATGFHAISPVRVYDSRLAAYAPNGPLMPNSDRTVSVKDGRDAAGAIVAVDAVPAGATAITFNLTASGPVGPNYLSVVPGDAPGFTTSSINFPGGFDAANGSVVRLDAARQVKIFCGDQSGSTHVILDVTGYFA